MKGRKIFRINFFTPHFSTKLNKESLLTDRAVSRENGGRRMEDGNLSEERISSRFMEASRFAVFRIHLLASPNLWEIIRIREFKVDAARHTAKSGQMKAEINQVSRKGAKS